MRYLSSGCGVAPGRSPARLPQLLGSAILAAGLLIAAAGGAQAGHSVIEIGVDSTAASFAGDIEVEIDWDTTYTNRTVVIKNTASQPVRLDNLTSGLLQGASATSFSRLSDSGEIQLEGGGSRSIQYSFSRTGSPGVREAYFTFTAVHLQGNGNPTRNYKIILRGTVPIADGVAPTTTATADPAVPNGSNGWYTNDVTVALDATDNPGGTGVASISYSLYSNGALTAMNTVSGSSTGVLISAEGTHVLKFRARDNASPANLEAEQSLTIHLDKSAPDFTEFPGDTILEATAPDGTSGSFSAIAADTVDPDPTVSFSLAADGSSPVVSPHMFPLGATTVYATAIDRAGNWRQKSFDVTVEDTTPPVIGSVPDDITAEATGATGAVVSFSGATASDGVDGPVAVSYSPASGSLFPLGATVVTVTASDAAGNTATATFTVTVQDTTAPILHLPANIIMEATSADGAVASFSATATDLVDGAITVSCSPASGSTFGLGTTSVVCTATDAHGNTASGSFTVTVQDTTPPDVTVPTDITAEATGAAGAAVSFAAGATDIVDGVVSVSCTPGSGSTFSLGTTTVMCTATDAHGNTVSKSFSVTVVDTTPPTISGLPGEMTVEATGPAGAVVPFSTVTASDLVDGAITVSCSPASGSMFALGTTTVTCTATDAHGNTAAATFTVTVQDTTAPVITLPGPITATATSASGAVVNFTASAMDLVDGAVSVSCLPGSGTMFGLGMKMVVVTATDARGNTCSGSFPVTVAYSCSGVLPPINLNGSSVFKQGSTVPVKFQLTGTSAGITDAVARLYIAKISNSVVGTELEAVSTAAATTGCVFRYDASSGHYIFNWGTKGLTAGTYQLRIDMGDGDLTHTVNVSLK
jgi:hypothetical protein